MLRQRYQGYHTDPNMPLYKWKVILNYAYRTLKILMYMIWILDEKSTVLKVEVHI